MDLTIQQLVHDLNHDDITVRVHAATLIGWQGEQAVEAVPALIEMLVEAESRDRRMAALTLGNIGPAASEAVPVLLHAMTEDEDESVHGLLGATPSSLKTAHGFYTRLMTRSDLVAPGVICFYQALTWKTEPVLPHRPRC